MTASLRVLIVDDEPLARAHLRSMLEARGDATVIGECGDGTSAVARILADAPDLVLLDVQMPELDGLEVVRQVGPERMPPTIFITAFDEHALEAFEVHAVDYVLKPVNRQRFARAIDHVRRQATTARQSTGLAEAVAAMREPRAGADRLAVRIGERVLYLRVADFDWIEAAGDIARIHVGRQVYEHRATLTQLEQRLPRERFVRVHRSTIVNTDRIAEFQPWFQGDWIIVLADGTRLQSGKSYRARVRSLMEG
ncbi:MAG: response regulator transcription factor [Gemmatimonadaceae bacterium]|nr:response regulator transcription factor [Gemmatimonadaceae bacterium]